jgi:hypothetical protein
MIRTSGIPTSTARNIICSTQRVPLEPDLTYSEHPIRVLDQKVRVTQKRTLKFYKVQWNQHAEDEATLETQDFLEKNFPRFLASYNL